MAKHNLWKGAIRFPQLGGEKQDTQVLNRHLGHQLYRKSEIPWHSIIVNADGDDYA